MTRLGDAITFTAGLRPSKDLNKALNDIDAKLKEMEVQSGQLANASDRFTVSARKGVTILDSQGKAIKTIVKVQKQILSEEQKIAEQRKEQARKVKEIERSERAAIRRRNRSIANLRLQNRFEASLENQLNRQARTRATLGRQQERQLRNASRQIVLEARATREAERRARAARVEGSRRFSGAALTAGGAFLGATGSFAGLGVGFAAMSGGPTGAAIVGIATALGGFIRAANSAEQALVAAAGSAEDFGVATRRILEIVELRAQSLERGRISQLAEMSGGQLPLATIRTGFLSSLDRAQALFFSGMRSPFGREQLPTVNAILDALTIEGNIVANRGMAEIAEANRIQAAEKATEQIQQWQQAFMKQEDSAGARIREITSLLNSVGHLLDDKTAKMANSLILSIDAADKAKEEEKRKREAEREAEKLARERAAEERKLMAARERLEARRTSLRERLDPSFKFSREFAEIATTLGLGAAGDFARDTRLDALDKLNPRSRGFRSATVGSPFADISRRISSMLSTDESKDRERDERDKEKLRKLAETARAAEATAAGIPAVIDAISKLKPLTAVFGR